MSVDTTAMQELINDLNRFKESHLSIESIYGLEIAIEQAGRLLSKEKEQIESAYFDGVEKELNGDAISPQEYFNQTYNNQ